MHNSFAWQLLISCCCCSWRSPSLLSDRYILWIWIYRLPTVCLPGCADCLPAWLRGCLMTSNDCTRDRIAIKYRIFGFRVWRSKQRIEQTIECIHQILLLCLPPPLKRSTDLNDRNVHEISICSNVIFEHNLSIDEGGNPSKWKREIERVFAIDLTSQEVSLCVFVFVFGFESSRNSTTTAKAKKKK